MKKICSALLLAVFLMTFSLADVFAEEVVEEIVLEEETPQEFEEEEVAQAEASYSGWYQQYGNYYYYVRGARVVGWQNIGGKTFYFKKTGDSVAKGKLLTGWQNINGKTYYFKKTGNAGTKGKLFTGWQSINGKTYYFKKTGNAGTKGKLFTGWQNVNGKRFFFKQSGAKGVKGEMLTGWWQIDDDVYYFKKSGAKGVKGCMFKGWQSINGTTYRFDSNGRYVKTVEINNYLSKPASALAAQIKGAKKDNSVSFPYYALQDSKGITAFSSGGISWYPDHISHVYSDRSANITFCNMYIGQDTDAAWVKLTAAGWEFISSEYTSSNEMACVFYRAGVEDEYLGLIENTITNKVIAFEYFFYEM